MATFQNGAPLEEFQSGSVSLGSAGNIFTNSTAGTIVKIKIVHKGNAGAGISVDDGSTTREAEPDPTSTGGWWYLPNGYSLHSDSAGDFAYVYERRSVV